jgi:hypothetical protein
MRSLADMKVGGLEDEKDKRTVSDEGLGTRDDG